MPEYTVVYQDDIGSMRYKPYTKRVIVGASNIGEAIRRCKSMADDGVIRTVVTLWERETVDAYDA